MAKRAVVISPAAQTADIGVKKEKLARTCKREGCIVLLKRRQKDYCSKVHRNQSVGLLGGAETKYEDRVAGDLFDEYAKRCKDGNDPTLIPTKTGYITIPNAIIPSREDFAEFLYEKGIRIHITTLDNWEKAHPDFAYAMDRLQRLQKVALLNHGASGRYSASHSRLILSVNHGMHEKKLIDKNMRFVGVLKAMYEGLPEDSETTP